MRNDVVGHHLSCASFATVPPVPLDRRGFLGVGAAGVAAALVGARPALASHGAYDAMVLNCIDPRFQEAARTYTAAQKLTGRYSQFTIAGAAIGVVAPRFTAWHETFWENLRITIALHEIHKVIVMNHRQCGAAEEAYGKAAVATAELETRTHRLALAEFRRQLALRHPQLDVETGLITRDGKLEVLS
jgi:hypothetical protein